MIIPFEDLFAEEALEETPASRTRTVRAADDPPPDSTEDEKKPKSTRPRPGPGQGGGGGATSRSLSEDVTVQPFQVGKSSEDKPNIFAILIGIDKYDYPNADLYGCVRDSIQVEKYLRSEVPGASDRLYVTRLRSPFPDATPQELEVGGPEPKALREAPPTRQSVIDHLLDIATVATKNDVILLHYSGHGSFEKRPPELDHLSAAKNDKGRATTLFLKDSQTTVDGNLVQHLRDKELSWLLNKIAANNPHIVTIMDCCNSAGNTRMAKEKDPQVRVRYTKSSDDSASISTYAFYEENKDVLDKNPKEFKLPTAPHVGMYACRSYQLAKEWDFDDGTFGVFTYSLLNTLRSTKGNISYKDLVKMVRTKASATVVHQTPLWFSTDPKMGEMRFLGGDAADNQSAYTVTAGDNSGEAKIDGGTLHGLIDPAKGTTSFLVFTAGKDVKGLKPSDGRTATLTTIGTESSTITFDDGKNFPDDAEFMKAIVTAEPLTKTTVSIVMESQDGTILDPTDAGKSTDDKVKALVKAKDDVTAALGPNKFVEVADGASEFRIFVYYRDDGNAAMRIAAKDNINALVQIIPGFSRSAVQKIVAQISHIAKWDRTLKLQNENPSIIRPGDVSIEVIRQVEKNGKKEEEVVPHNGEVVVVAAPANTPKKSNLHPRLKFRVRLNANDQVPLYCAMVNMNSEYGIPFNMLNDGDYLGKPEQYNEAGIKIDTVEKTELSAGADADNPTGRFMRYSLPKHLQDDPFAAVEDHIKLIVSTVPFDPSHMLMPNLPAPGSTRAGGTKPAPRKIGSALDALLSQANTRMGRWDDDEDDAEEQPINDWWTTTVTIRTVATDPENLPEA